MLLAVHHPGRCRHLLRVGLRRAVVPSDGDRVWGGVCVGGSSDPTSMADVSQASSQVVVTERRTQESVITAWIRTTALKNITLLNGRRLGLSYSMVVSYGTGSASPAGNETRLQQGAGILKYYPDSLARAWKPRINFEFRSVTLVNMASFTVGPDRLQHWAPRT